MRRVIYFGLAFLIWVGLTWPFADGKVDIQVMIAGLVASLITAILFHEILPKEHLVFVSPIRIFWLLVYLPVFFYYVMKANLDVVYRALHTTATGITALANSITLTPGTLTIDLTDDGFLYIHWINVRSSDIDVATRLIAQRFEWFLKRICE